jgi:hypothetical protein
MDVFTQEYILQLHREIDTEKQERDKILHFTILLLTSYAIGIASELGHSSLLIWPSSIYIGIPVISIIDVLFWLRIKKLFQIYDRWATLRNLVKHHPLVSIHSIEEKVYSRRINRTYSIKDILIPLILSFPVIAAIVFSLYNVDKYILSIYYGISILILQLTTCFVMTSIQQIKIAKL